MKPYGQKHKKSKLGIHNSDVCHCEVCNTGGWNKSKSRERTSEKSELNSLPEEDKYVDFSEVEYLVQVKRMEPEDGREYFIAYYKPLGISVIGVTPDHAMDGMAQAYYTHFPFPKRDE